MIIDSSSRPNIQSSTPTIQNSKTSEGYGTTGTLSEAEQRRAYDALSRACHDRQILESQGYILPGSIRADMEEITSVLYVHFQETPKPSSKTTKANKRKAVAIHCDRVLVHVNQPAVAIISAVDVLTGDILINAYVNPAKKVFDWRTDITGINGSKMRSAVRNKQTLNGWQIARSRLFSFIDSNTILVGHEVQNTLGVLGIFHDRIVDTAILTAQAVFGTNNSQFPRKWRLEHISSTLFLREMSAVNGYSNCLERAQVAREIALCVQEGVVLTSWGTQARIEYKYEQQQNVELIKQKIHNLLAEHRLTKNVKVGILIEGLDD